RGRGVVVPLPSGPAALRDASGRAVVVVGRADEAEAEGVHAEAVLEREAVLQRVPHQVAGGILVDRDRPAGRSLLRRVLLFEGTELVRRPRPGARQPVETALRVALDL